VDVLVQVKQAARIEIACAIKMRYYLTTYRRE